MSTQQEFRAIAHSTAIDAGMDEQDASAFADSAVARAFGKDSDDPARTEWYNARESGVPVVRTLPKAGTKDAYEQGLDSELFKFGRGVVGAGKAVVGFAAAGGGRLLTEMAAGLEQQGAIPPRTAERVIAWANGLEPLPAIKTLGLGPRRSLSPTFWQDQEANVEKQREHYKENPPTPGPRRPFGGFFQPKFDADAPLKRDPFSFFGDKGKLNEVRSKFPDVEAVPTTSGRTYLGQKKKKK
ncbi:MAG: hypothetical protein GY838_13690 [bacterium]|nr:hypothetical protein [bacterium]